MNGEWRKWEPASAASTSQCNCSARTGRAHRKKKAATRLLPAFLITILTPNPFASCPNRHLSVHHVVRRRSLRARRAPRARKEPSESLVWGRGSVAGAPELQRTLAHLAASRPGGGLPPFCGDLGREAPAPPQAAPRLVVHARRITATAGEDEPGRKRREAGGSRMLLSL